MNLKSRDRRDKGQQQQIEHIAQVVGVDNWRLCGCASANLKWLLVLAGAGAGAGAGGPSNGDELWARGDDGPEEPPKPPPSTRGRLLALQLRFTIMTLEQKVLGFIVGWAWFDALHTALDHRITVPWGFALVTTLICSLLAVRESYLGEGIQAAGSEYAKERILLTNAVGLMQGWAWSEAVDRWVAHYRPRSGAVTEQILV